MNSSALTPTLTLLLQSRYRRPIFGLLPPPTSALSVFLQTRSRRDGVRCGLGGARVGPARGVCAGGVGLRVASVPRVGEVQRHSGSSRVHQHRHSPGSHTPVSAPLCEKGIWRIAFSSCKKTHTTESQFTQRSSSSQNKRLNSVL